MKYSDIPLPKAWPKQVKSIILHVISLAHFSLIHSRSWAANSPIQRVRLIAERDQAITKASQLEEILRIISARMGRTPAHQRPNYTSIERQAILEIMAANGWSIAQTARVFMVDPDTKYGSIAIDLAFEASWRSRLERLIRSVKSECTRKIIIPLRQTDMRHELGFYFSWYNEFRPHQGIKGKTPIELYSGISHAPPNFNIRDPNLKLNLQVAYLHERPHLPIISLERAA